MVYKTSFQMTGFRFGILFMAAALPLLAASCAGRNGNDGGTQDTETPDEVQVPDTRPEVVMNFSDLPTTGPN